MGLLMPLMMGILASLAMRLVVVLDLGKELPPNTPDCQLLGGDWMMPVEDIVTYRPGILIGAAGYLMKAVEQSPEMTPEGFLVAVDMRSGTPELKNLTMTKTPLFFSFHPHGIFYSKKRERLYVVNHGGTTHIGTRIEIFEVQKNPNGLPEFEWKSYVGGDHTFGNMALNAVAEGFEPSDLYVTQWKAFPSPALGDENPRTPMEVMRVFSEMLITIGAWKGLTGVHFCIFNPKSRLSSCSLKAGGMVAANGLTTNPEGSWIKVVDPVRHEIRHFRRRGVHGDLVEEEDKREITPHKVDNLHYDAASQELWAGTIAIAKDYLVKAEHIAGTFLVGKPKEGGGYEWHDAIVHDGSLLSQFSACAKASSPKSPGTVWGFCVSPASPGVLACPLPNES